MSICRAGREAKIWRSLIAGFLRGANMADLVRTGLSLERELLEKFDETIARRGYQNRSEAIRDLIREHLVSEEGDQNKVIAGTLTMVYDHHRPNLSARLTGIQHSAHTQVLAATHVHLDHHNCLEVVIMKRQVRRAEASRRPDSQPAGCKAWKICDYDHRKGP